MEPVKRHGSVAISPRTQQTRKKKDGVADSPGHPPARLDGLRKADIRRFLPSGRTPRKTGTCKEKTCEGKTLVARVDGK